MQKFDADVDVDNVLPHGSSDGEEVVGGSCSGYWYVSISISLFGYFSCQRSGLLKALSLSRSKLLCKKLARLRHCLIG